MTKRELKKQIRELQAQVAELAAELAECREATPPPEPPPDPDPPPVEPPPDAKILAEDLCTDPDPIPLWKQITAASPIQVTYDIGSPDPHIAVGQSKPSTHYRTLYLDDAKLTEAVTFRKSSFTVKVDSTEGWPSKGSFSTPRPSDVQVHYTGKTAATLTGCTADAEGTFPAGTRIACQDTYAQGQPGNETYRTQLVNNSETSTFHRYDPGDVTTTYLSVQFMADTPLVTGASEGSQVWQVKQTKASGAPIISAVEFADVLRLRTNIDKKLRTWCEVPINRASKWMRFALELASDADPKKGSMALWVSVDNGGFKPVLPPTPMQTLYDQSNQGRYATLSIGPYQDAEVPAVWRSYANVQVVEGRFAA